MPCIPKTMDNFLRSNHVVHNTYKLKAKLPSIMKGFQENTCQPILWKTKNCYWKCQLRFCARNGVLNAWTKDTERTSNQNKWGREGRIRVCVALVVLNLICQSKWKSWLWVAYNHALRILWCYAMSDEKKNRNIVITFQDLGVFLRENKFIPSSTVRADLFQSVLSLSLSLSLSL
jgi:hypothetical protein